MVVKIPKECPTTTAWRGIRSGNLGGGTSTWQKKQGEVNNGIYDLPLFSECFFFPLIILVYWRKTLSKSVIRFLSAKVPLCKVMHNHSGHDHCHAAHETSCTCEVVTS